MRTKKCPLIIAGTLIVLLITTYLAIKICRTYPDVSVYYSLENRNCCSDDGLYFVKNLNYIYHLDQKTGVKAPVCRKTNCLHNDSRCNAFVEADLPPGIMSDSDEGRIK